MAAPGRESDGRQRRHNEAKPLLREPAPTAPSRYNLRPRAKKPRLAPTQRPESKPMRNPGRTPNTHNGNKPRPTAHRSPSTIRTQSTPNARNNTDAIQRPHGLDASSARKNRLQPRRHAWKAEHKNLHGP